jgi:hypothetical protein
MHGELITPCLLYLRVHCYSSSTEVLTRSDSDVPAVKSGRHVSPLSAWAKSDSFRLSFKNFGSCSVTVISDSY